MYMYTVYITQCVCFWLHVAHCHTQAEGGYRDEAILDRHLIIRGRAIGGGLTHVLQNRGNCDC